MLFLAPLILVNATLLAELIASLPRSQPIPPERLGAERKTIIVPAHNEAFVIGPTIKTLQEAAGTEFEILVVADNCTDDTAKVARALGVRVAVRNDPGTRGKGYALAFARDWLRAAPPAAIIILDADCRTDSDSLNALATAVLRKNLPCQAINLLEATRSSGAMVQISTFAFLIKNLVRQRGLQRLTGGVHLTGTGMGFPWMLFDQADLATSSIVEDVRLGVEMTEIGAAPQLVEECRVWSAHAASNDTLGQRRRWEGGFLSIALSAGPVTVAQGFRRLDFRKIVTGLDLLVPPLAILAMLNAFAILCLVLLQVAGWTNSTPLAALGIVDGLLCVVMAFSWWRDGRDVIGMTTFLSLPLYALWKVPMYLSLARKGAPAIWERTPRTRTDREA
jgi:cellulose synthase/poly-beta-1,6-N-acetylglucosamine synthase-like glycosyltransferase